MRGALAGLRVLDFSGLLPGPLATLYLADAGADVIKIERPEGGDGMRADAAVFAILNRAKRSIAIDLKRDSERMTPLIETSDILVEQFRPGVMDRLGLGYEAVSAINPGIIYISINGYGSEGPHRLKVGHDLTYSAESGLLGLNTDTNGTPVMPSVLAIDVVGGSMAALANVLLALYHRERTGVGARIEVPMFKGAMPFLFEPLAHVHASSSDFKPGSSGALGSTARYNIYATADGRHLACTPVESAFWSNFCDITSLPESADVQAVRTKMLERTAAEWLTAFEGRDVCCSLIATIPEAFASDAIRQLLDRQVEGDGINIPALPRACLQLGLGIPKTRFI